MRTGYRVAWAWGWCCFAIACGDTSHVVDGGGDTSDEVDSGNDTSADTSADTGGDGGGDGGGFTVVPDPILGRASLGTHACAIAREAERVPDGQFRVESLIAIGDHAVASRAAERMQLSTVDIGGDFGPEVALETTDSYASQASLARVGDALGVVWLRQDGGGGAEIMFARVAAADLTVEVPATALAVEGASYGALPQLAAGAQGWGLVAGVTDPVGAVLRYWPLAIDGTLGAPVILARGAGDAFGFAASLLREADGWAAVWAQGTWDAGEVWFARFDEDGLRGEARRISQPAGDVSSSLGYTAGGALVAVGGRTFATFTETRTRGGFPDQATSVIARIARIDDDGVALHALQDHVVDKTVTTPQLVAYGGQLAVVYTYGTVIYICAGCITDYDVHLALLDPATLAPVAAEVVLRHDLDGARNGLTNPRVAPLGDGLLVSASLDFHALSYPATGAFTCGPR